MASIVQAIMTGILLGGLYALIGVGMSLIFGIMKITNIAHGDLMILSAFFTLMLTANLFKSIILALIVSIIIMIVIGVLVQKFLINSVIDKGSEPALLVTFGLSIVLQNAMILKFGPNSQLISTAISEVNIFRHGQLSMSGQYLLNFVVAVVIIVILTILINRTSLGRGIRATSNDVMAAELMGINTKRMYIIAMALTMTATCIAGLLVGSTFVFYPSSGTQYLIIAFGVVVIGGMGSIPGTLIGGIILGVTQLLGASIFGTPYQMLTGYVVLLILLTLRPQGLLGKAKRK
ncbi:MAG: branched-chain amino acid ABC transporter permease [Oscillospiraceae bacterium]|nr:branched-chain amino acid ABC transporter permease [Oscillospiraceae bacterium]